MESVHVLDGARLECTIREEFAKLPEEWERDYELILTRMVNTEEVTEDALKRIISDFCLKWDTHDYMLEDTEEKIAYAAVYCLSIFYRHNLDIDKFEQVCKKNTSWCERHKSFEYLKIMHNMHIPESLRGKENEYLKFLYCFAQKYDKNAGYAHAFANLYAEICERNHDKQAYFCLRWGRKASHEIERAIYLDSNYALYYCTKGRIAIIEGEYEMADKLFDKAIQMEDSAKAYYTIRISRYQSYRAQAQALLFTANIQREIEMLKGANISNIEILSFFSAVVAFIMGSLTLAKDQTAANAAILIAVLMGALLFVFSAFSFLLQINTRRNAKIYILNVVVAFIGAMVVIGGVYIVS